MNKINESNITIMVSDMDKAIQFYQSIGLTLKQRWENHYAMITAPGITLGLHPSEAKENNSGTVSIGFMVDDINEAKKLLDENSISYKFEDEKSGAYVNFKDADGTILYFTQPKWKY